jgi:hypothetical protein
MKQRRAHLLLYDRSVSAVSVVSCARASIPNRVSQTDRHWFPESDRPHSENGCGKMLTRLRTAA